LNWHPSDEVDERDIPKPALASIPAARRYMGSIGRSKFYADILPLLQTVKFGSWRFVVVKSMDRLIAERASAERSPSTTQADA
jgi:hypothetical protein